MPGHVLGYDRESEFGLFQARQPLPAPAVQLGISAECDVGDPAVFVSAPIDADREATGP